MNINARVVALLCAVLVSLLLALAPVMWAISYVVYLVRLRGTRYARHKRDCVREKLCTEKCPCYVQVCMSVSRLCVLST